MDEFDGQGGSYLEDPVTGRRTLVDRTQPADASPADPAPVEPATEEE